METAFLGAIANKIYKGAKGAPAGFSAAGKDPKEVLNECKSNLEAALAKLNSYHAVHASGTNSEE
jgi:hypothetical protein